MQFHGAARGPLDLEDLGKVHHLLLLKQQKKQLKMQWLWDYPRLKFVLRDQVEEEKLLSER